LNPGKHYRATTTEFHMPTIWQMRVLHAVYQLDQIRGRGISARVVFDHLPAEHRPHLQQVARTLEYLYSINWLRRESEQQLGKKTETIHVYHPTSAGRNLIEALLIKT
jgi:hypothetical protein